MMEHHASILPPPPAGKTWRMVWNDEFDGPALDETKWSYRLHLLQKRHETFTDEGLSFADSCVRFNLIGRNGHFYSQHLQTGENFMDRPGKICCFAADNSPKFVWPVAGISKPKFERRYGYYECRCKLQEKPGWWSAFWLQSPVQGCSLDPAAAGVEVDIMESFERDGVTQHVLHWGGCGDDHRFAASPKIKITEASDGFHIFGCLWTPRGYRFYIDGAETWRSAAAVSRRPQFILLSTECMGYRLGDAPDPRLRAAAPDAFIVDFVRVHEACAADAGKGAAL